MFFKYPKIKVMEQFMAEDEDKDLFSDTSKTYTVTGKVKLHGTNAAYVYDTKSKQINLQSRNRIITVDSDNHGFCAWLSKSLDRQYKLKEFCLGVEKHCKKVSPEKNITHVIVYGEFAGGKISPNVALAKFSESFFCAFDVYVKEEGVDEAYPLVDYPLYLLDAREYSIVSTQADESLSFTVENFPSAESVEEIKRLTEIVGEHCPFGALYDYDGKGEGIVWELQDEDKSYKFKTIASAYKKTKPLKVVKADKNDSPLNVDTQAFLAEALHENRLNQGLDYLKEMGMTITMKNFGAYIAWLSGDIIAEESYKLKEKYPEEDEQIIKLAIRKGFNAYVNYVIKPHFMDNLGK